MSRVSSSSGCAPITSTRTDTGRPGERVSQRRRAALLSLAGTRREESDGGECVQPGPQPHGDESEREI